MIPREKIMGTYKTETTLTKDGMIVLNNVPFHAGDRVEVILVPAIAATTPQTDFPLRGKVLEYRDPTEPVAEADWEAIR